MGDVKFTFEHSFVPQRLIDQHLARANNGLCGIKSIWILYCALKNFRCLWIICLSDSFSLVDFMILLSLKINSDLSIFDCRHLIGQYVTIHDDVISHMNISEVESIDGGAYTCKAINAVGTVTHTARINVYGKIILYTSPLC